jgi:hypothetical protein
VSPNRRQPRLFRRAERWLLALFGRAERHVAWVLCLGAVGTFAAVLAGLLVEGQLRVVTLLAAASLAFDGYSALRDAYDDEPETG